MTKQIILLDMHKGLKFVEDKMGISKHDVSKFVECYGIVKLFVKSISLTSISDTL
jgi:hypothetical protein